MNNQNNYGKMLGTVGLVGGLFYAMKNNKNMGVTALYMFGLGLAGVVIGNSISKFVK